MSDERLRLLLQRHLDDVMTPAERAELNRLLLESAHARDVFWQEAQWHAALRQWGEAQWGGSEQIPEPVAARPRRAVRLAWAAAAAVLLSGLAALLWPKHGAPAAASVAGGTEDPFEIEAVGWKDLENAPSSGVAVLTRASGVTWAAGSPVHGLGEVLSPGRVALAAGALQLEFSRGARVVLEGPAELEIVSENEVVLRSGKVRAQVPPPAVGFTVRAGDYSIVDFGTEFGCVIPKGGLPEVHVLSGGVEVHGIGGSLNRPLKTNQAIRLGAGRTEDIPAQRDLFLSEEELGRRETEQARRWMKDWRSFSRELSGLPHAVMHLDFERDDRYSRTLINRATATSDDASLAASIVGCDWTGGRWPGKSALEFKRSNDRVRLSIPGSYPAVTLISWLSLDSLPHKQHSLLMGESFLPGELHWYVYSDGSLGLAVRSDVPAENRSSGQWRVLHSPPVIRPDTFGTWIMVASSCDTATGEIAHYFNGELLRRVNRGVKVPIQPGLCEIGNWGVRPEDPRWLEESGNRSPSRSLHARMDEFALFGRLVTPEEIHQYYLRSLAAGTVATESR